MVSPCFGCFFVSVMISIYHVISKSQEKSTKNKKYFSGEIAPILKITLNIRKSEISVMVTRPKRNFNTFFFS